MSRDGSWISVPLGPRQMMMMGGLSLSLATAGKLPAVVHRVVVGAGDSRAGSSSSSSSTVGRLSLAFKLLPAPTAVLDPPAITGLSAAQLPARYHVAKTGQQLLDEFEVSHVSVNQPGQQQLPQDHHQQQQQEGLQHEPQPQPASKAAGNTRASRAAASMTAPVRAAARAAATPGPTGAVGTAAAVIVGAKRPGGPAEGGVRHTKRVQQQQQQQQQHAGNGMAQADDPLISLELRGPHAEAVKFRVEKRTTLEELLKVYCHETGLEENSVYAVFDGTRLNCQCTVGLLCEWEWLQDGDIIDVCKEKTGD